MPRAFKRPRRPLVVVVLVAATPNYLGQASPDRGKYTNNTLELLVREVYPQHHPRNKYVQFLFILVCGASFFGQG